VGEHGLKALTGKEDSGAEMRRFHTSSGVSQLMKIRTSKRNSQSKPANTGNS
jgi:hypothetical protein